MYIAMPSPNGTNKAGLFLPASRFANAAAAYNSARGLSRRALRAYDQLSTQPNSGVPWNLADERETAKYGLGRSGAEDDEDDETNGNGEQVHEILRRARASLSDKECHMLKTILGRMIMAENEPDEDDDEEDAVVASRFETNGDRRRRMGRDRDEPLPKNALEGGMGGAADKRHAKDVRRAQDAAWQHVQNRLAFDAATRKRRDREQAAAAAEFAAIPRPRDLTVYHAAPTPRMATDAAADRDFAARHPEVARIKVI